MALKDKILEKAQKYLLKGNIDRALAEYRSAADIDPRDISIRLRIGDLYVKTNRTQEAIKEYTDVARANAQRGFYPKAIAVYKKVLKLDSSILDIHYKLAELYTKQRLIADAISSYSYIVSVFEKSGKTSEVMELLKKMLDIDPDNVGIRLKLADLFLKLSFDKDAVSEYARIFEKLIADGKVDRAEKVFLSLHNSRPNEPVILDSLAKVYKSKGDNEKFLQYATPLLKAYKKNEDVGRALELSKSILEVRPDDAAALEVVHGVEPPELIHKEPEPQAAPGAAAVETPALEGAGAGQASEEDFSVAESRVSEDEPMEGSAGEAEDAQEADSDTLISWPEEEIEISVEGFEDDEAPSAEPVEDALKDEEEFVVTGAEPAVEEEPAEDGQTALVEDFSVAESRVTEDEPMEESAAEGEGAQEPLTAEEFQPEEQPQPEEEDAIEEPAPAKVDIEEDKEPEAAQFEAAADEPEQEAEVEIDLGDYGMAATEPATSVEEPVEEPIEEPAEEIEEAPEEVAEAEEPAPAEEPVAGQEQAPEEALAEEIEEEFAEEIEEAASEEPLAVDEPVAEQEAPVEAAAEAAVEAVEEDIAVEEPVADEPVAEEPAEESPVAEVEEAESEEPVAVDEPVVEQEAPVEAAVEEPFEVEDAGEEQAPEEPLAEETPAEESPAAEMEEQAEEEIAIEESFAEEPVEKIEGPAVEQEPAPEEPFESFEPEPGEPIEERIERVLADEPFDVDVDVPEPSEDESETAEADEEPYAVERPAAEEPAAGADESTAGSMESLEMEEELSSAIEELQARMETGDELLEPDKVKVEESAPESEFIDLSAELGMEEALEGLAGTWTRSEGESTDAFDEYKDGIGHQLSKEDTETHYNLGIAYMEMELFDEASKEFKIALKEPRLEGDCYARLGLCAMAESKPDEAVMYYLKGLKVEGKSGDERKGMMYELALAYEAAGDMDEAFQLFTSINDLDPGYREVAEKLATFGSEHRRIPYDDGLIEVELL